MEFETVKEWLDKLIDTYTELKNLKYCNTQIEICGVHDFIQVYSGIEIIADAMGIKLWTKYDKENTEYPYKYYFGYRGYEIMQICEEPLEGVTDGTD